jgi:hypothetical protein
MNKDKNLFQFPHFGYKQLDVNRLSQNLANFVFFRLLQKASARPTKKIAIKNGMLPSATGENQ